MSRLNKELGLLQGIALLSTSLLGTGIFVVPALAATAAGEASLWAWLMLIALVLPVASGALDGSRINLRAHPRACLSALKSDIQQRAT